MLSVVKFRSRIATSPQRPRTTHCTPLEIIVIQKVSEIFKSKFILVFI